jgi:chromosomal replication initiation ATPase DnaA
MTTTTQASTTAAPGTPLDKIETIKRIVAADFGVMVWEIDSPARTVPLPQVRHVAMFLTSRLVPHEDASFPEIARAFNRINHNSVVHGIEATATRMETSRAFRSRVERLEAEAKAALSP